MSHMICSFNFFKISNVLIAQKNYSSALLSDIDLLVHVTFRFRDILSMSLNAG